MKDNSLNIYTIPQGFSFLENLAAGLLKQTQGNPFRLSQMEVFLPSRRACLELKRTLLRQVEGRCLLLPKLLPLGDIDEEEELLRSPAEELELPPLMSPLRRLGLLAKLVDDYTQKSGLPSSPSLSFKLAKSLIKLMDQAAIENIPWEGLRELVPSEFAGHWQLTLDFLEIVITHWPRILEEKGVSEPYPRHHRLVDLLIARFEKSPSSHSIIAAGSTGTMPATARLLQAIARLPNGMVILPGLDTSLSAEEAKDLSPCHPQYALARFLEKVEKVPQDVPLWPPLEGRVAHPRATLLSHALKPLFVLPDLLPQEALDGVYSIPCPTPQEEALAISILIRQHLETPNQRIALITADVRLAERVKAELARWKIEIDSSFGQPLDQTLPGVFLKLCAEYSAAPEEPVCLLALLKHPLCCIGRATTSLRKEIHDLEKHILRGDKAPLKDSGLLKDKELFIPPETSFTGYRKMAERLATDDQGTCHLWKGLEGEAVRTFLKSLEEVSEDFPLLSPSTYPEVLKELLRGQNFRSPVQKHPRLSILGSIEARLFHADVMILGGLNEGTWPPDIEMDPWLNRPMRKDLGFPSPERRIGLAAHDFSQAFASPKVYLTRALKVDGTPTLACRWLERLDAYLKGCGLSLPQETRVLKWAQHLDSPEAQTPRPTPLPIPPVDTRPRRLSVTQIETWMRNPYGLYARSILSLRPLDPLVPENTMAEMGTLMHAILDQFFKSIPDPFDPYALEGLRFIGKTLSEPYEADPSVHLFWRPRFTQFANWFIETERQTRLPGTKTFTEIRGKLTLTTPLGPFECTAKADRIDLLPDGRLRIIDYKTGSPPSDQDVFLGFSPQLPLEGAIALHQGFEGIYSTTLESLQYWWVRGDARGSLIRSIPGDPRELAIKALEGLQRMILLFEDNAIPYSARPVPSKALKYDDYLHLARLTSVG
jgi:ATP-dependent helicase/nuclease subunit B